ncbi:hypothetical protein JA33_275 [Dickeya phage vB_DsoM_JA33]|uniref:Uncharacterized protein n=2 Tax=Salmondvirus JA11 TaxID=2734141 RepID=A0A386K714_9CAUD|nr:hypothetical protein HOU32_gp274 [Dickeya phage vB_DsoM_JA11]AXG67649.1 hypothetical protein JA33_275 [Dickeya phage vB_DsoM_JA33]AYD80079.1 hypothetical protein JA11_274 [Dickeya phage vB_DsoM_JA11]
MEAQILELASFTDNEIDALHNVLSDQEAKTREEKIKFLLSYQKSSPTIKSFRPFLENGIKPAKPKPEKDLPDPKIIRMYTRHNNPTPFILYLASYGLSADFIASAIVEHFEEGRFDFPSQIQVEQIIASGKYELEPVAYHMQYVRICEVARRFRFSGYNLFYSPLYFDGYHESQGGWGMTLSEKDSQKFGYAMLGGDTVHCIIDTITHTARFDTNKLRK